MVVKEEEEEEDSLSRVFLAQEEEEEDEERGVESVARAILGAAECRGKDGFLMTVTSRSRSCGEF